MVVHTIHIEDRGHKKQFMAGGMICVYSCHSYLRQLTRRCFMIKLRLSLMKQKASASVKYMPNTLIGIPSTRS